MMGQASSISFFNYYKLLNSTQIVSLSQVLFIQFDLKQIKITSMNEDQTNWSNMHVPHVKE